MWKLDHTSPKNITKLKVQEYIVVIVPNVTFQILTNKVALSNTNLGIAITQLMGLIS